MNKNKSKNSYKNYEGLNSGLFYDLRTLFFGLNFYKKCIADIHITPGMNILDIGCGTGKLLLTIASKVDDTRLMGCDFSLGQINYAKLKSRKKGININFINSSMENIVLPEQSIDLLFSCLVFHSVCPITIQRVMQNNFNIIKNFGLFVFVDFLSIYNNVYSWNFLEAVKEIGRYGFRLLLLNNINLYIRRAIFIKMPYDIGTFGK